MNIAFVPEPGDQPDDDAPGGGQVSEGPNSLSNAETSVGGADSVPETPDAMPGKPGAALDTSG